MELYLIRHAQPAWVDAAGRGVNDPGLTPLGQAQAARVAAVHRSFGPVDVLWASPTVRTRQTVAPLSEALGLVPQIIEDLREIRTPDWEGHSAEAVAQVFEAAIDRAPDAWWDGLAGGERFTDFSARVRRALFSALAERGAAPRDGSPLWDVGQGTIAFVGHGGTNAVILETLLGVETVPWPWERFATAHASITRVQSKRIAGGHIWALRSYNAVDHIAPDERSR